MKIIKSNNKKPAQKTIMLYNMDLINALADEEAAVENTSPSVVIENCVLCSLFPKDDLLQLLLKDVYQNKLSIKQALVDLCSSLAMYGETKRCTSENISLVNFLKEEISGTVPNMDNNPQFYGAYNPTYLYSNIESITDHLLYNHNDSDCNDMRFLCDMWVTQIKTIPTNDTRWYKALFSLILDNWDDIFALPSTYKVLMEICKTCDESTFDDTPLYDFRHLFMQIEKSWV